MAVFSELAGIVGDSHLLLEDDRRAGYEVDITRRFSGQAAAVVRPGTTEEVAAVLAVCSRERLEVVPQGGNTGLAGGATPLGGEIILSSERLNRIGEVDSSSGQISVGGGVVLGALQRALVGSGLEFAVDFPARDSATIGGMVATNAGGPWVLGFGAMADQVVGLEVVTAGGEVIRRMDGLVKDNAGYDLIALLAGSEGTLAVITEARLRLIPESGPKVTALIALDGIEDAIALLARLRRGMQGLIAADFFHPNGLRLVCEKRGIAPPIDGEAGVYLIVEALASEGALESLAGIVGEVTDRVVVADDTARRQALWEYREAHNEAISAAGTPHKFDVALPAGEIAPFIDRAQSAISKIDPGTETIVYGHLGEGNLHVNVIGLESDDSRVDAAVLGLVAEHGGSINAEHGVGQAKAKWLHLVRSDVDIATMKRIKSAFDPAGLLNPGKLIGR